MNERKILLMALVVIAVLPLVSIPVLASLGAPPQVLVPFPFVWLAIFFRYIKKNEWRWWFLLLLPLVALMLGYDWMFAGMAHWAGRW